MTEYIEKQAVIDIVKKQYRYESNRMTDLQELPVVESAAISDYIQLVINQLEKEMNNPAFKVLRFKDACSHAFCLLSKDTQKYIERQAAIDILMLHRHETDQITAIQERSKINPATIANKDMRTKIEHVMKQLNAETNNPMNEYLQFTDGCKCALKLLNGICNTI